MAASRARWLVTASRTGRGGNAAPALLKWTTLATPGVSDLSNGTSSVIGVPRQARGSRLVDTSTGCASMRVCGTRSLARLARPSPARSVELGRQLPVEPRAERATHDELLVFRGQPRQLFREHRHALLPRDRHARDVRAPEHALGPERVVELANVS